jgi:predicted metal-dependent enzyme (double-stranded beta helix superfamily)
MFDLDRFIADCRAALKEAPGHRAVREVVARAVSDPDAVLRRIGEPRRAEVGRLHVSPDLVVLNVVWAPYMTVAPHNHNMWAVIGIYTGCEHNMFWRRLPDAEGGKIEAAGAKAMSRKDAVPLGQDIIHSVTNPIPRLTGAIHVYGGDFFGTGRSEWDPESLLEHPSSAEAAIRRFEEANAQFART